MSTFKTPKKQQCDLIGLGYIFIAVCQICGRRISYDTDVISMTCLH